MRNGIIFDFDGVLVDSLDSLFNIYFSVVEKYSDSVSISDVEDLNGRSITEICEFISNKYANNIDVDEIRNIYNEELLVLYSSLEISEYWKSTLDCFYGKFEMAIASGCDSRFVNMVLENNGLIHYFKTIVGGDLVVKAKPDPEIIHLTLSRCGWDNAVLIDDSQNGIKSGLAAGCTVLKYDLKLINNAKFTEMILLSLDNKLSYLGSSNEFDINLLSNYPPYYSDEEALTWDALESNGAYNSKILCVNHILDFDVKGIYAFENEYKRFRLGCEQPVLAVTGLVENSNNHYLCAIRKETNFQNVNQLDVVPSGSMASDCIFEQLKEEWIEETGSNHQLNWSPGYSFVFDHLNNVIDIILISKGNDFSIDKLDSSEVFKFQWLDFYSNEADKAAISANFIVSIVGV